MVAEQQDAGSSQAPFLLDVVQDLLEAEAKRDDAANARGIAVVALSGVLLALSATVSASVLAAGVARGWRVLAVVLLTVSIATLLAAALSAMLGVLRPRRFAMLATAEVRKFVTPEYLERADDANRQVLLTGLVDVLADERNRSARKAAWLRRSYALVLVAVTALALTGVLGAFRAAGIIPASHGVRSRPGSVHAAGGAAGRGRPGSQTPSAPAHRVRREGRR